MTYSKLNRGGGCGEERRHKWRAVEEEEASTSGPLQRGLLTWGIAAAL